MPALPGLRGTINAITAGGPVLLLTLVVSDIHANLEALEAVLADAPPYDSVMCLGDLVGYGPNPNECVEKVRGLTNVSSLVGNHDLAALDQLDLSQFNPHARYSAEWTMDRLTPEVRTYLLSLEPTMEQPGYFAAHASPRDPVWEYMESEEQGPPNFRAFEDNVCLVGHTHVPRIFIEQPRSTSIVTLPESGGTAQLNNGVRKIINPGSVGQPRNGDPRAAYGLMDTQDGVFQFRRVEYPYDVTQAKIRECGLPAVLAQRLAYGL
ncbi:MAG: metallophosphoesterase family protein [Chloroflexota bacterium]